MDPLTIAVLVVAALVAYSLFAGSPAVGKGILSKLDSAGTAAEEAELLSRLAKGRVARRLKTLVEDLADEPKATAPKEPTKPA